MRTCGFCGGELVHEGGWERTAEERAGNPTQADTFTCAGCSRKFWHGYEESFEGDEEWWNVWDGGRWRVLEKARWPT